jgi:hypothetical protein
MDVFVAIGYFSAMSFISAKKGSISYTTFTHGALDEEVISTLRAALVIYFQ